MKKHSLQFNTVLNGIKQVLSLLFPLITVPYISKHLGASSYGLYNYSSSIVAYFSYIAAIGCQTYGIREGALLRNNRKNAENVCSQIFSINVLFTIVSYVLMLLTILCFDRLDNYKFYILLLSTSILFTTIGSDWINVVYEDFSFVTIRYLIFQVLSIVLLFIFVKKPSDVLKYCLISVIASSGASLFNTIRRKKYCKISFTFNMNMKKHLPSMMVFFLSSIAGVIYVNSDTTIIGTLLGDYDVGIYSFAAKIYNMVKMTIAVIVSTAVPRVTFFYKNDLEKYKKHLSIIHSILLLILLPAVVGIIVLKDEIVEILGQNNFSDSTSILMLLAPCIIPAILGSFYCSLVLILRNKEKVMLFGTALGALVNVVLNILFIPKFGVGAAAITTFVAEMCNYFISSIYCIHNYKEYSNYKSLSLFFSIIISIIIIGLRFLINILLPGSEIVLCIIRCISLVVISLIIYYIILKNSKDPEINKILFALRSKK